MAHPDINKLLNSELGLPFAKRLLKDYGEFYPFGLAMELDGKMVAVCASDGDEHPPSQKIVELLKASFSRDVGKGKFRAIGIFL